jgi:hypothetical protein
MVIREGRGRSAVGSSALQQQRSRYGRLGVCVYVCMSVCLCHEGAAPKTSAYRSDDGEVWQLLTADTGQDRECRYAQQICSVEAGDWLTGRRRQEAPAALSTNEARHFWIGEDDAMLRVGREIGQSKSTHQQEAHQARGGCRMSQRLSGRGLLMQCS